MGVHIVIHPSGKNRENSTSKQAGRSKEWRSRGGVLVRGKRVYNAAGDRARGRG